MKKGENKEREAGRLFADEDARIRTILAMCTDETLMGIDKNRWTACYKLENKCIDPLAKDSFDPWIYVYCVIEPNSAKGNYTIKSASKIRDLTGLDNGDLNPSYIVITAEPFQDNVIVGASNINGKNSCVWAGDSRWQNGVGIGFNICGKIKCCVAQNDEGRYYFPEETVQSCITNCDLKSESIEFDEDDVSIGRKILWAILGSKVLDLKEKSQCLEDAVQLMSRLDAARLKTVEEARFAHVIPGAITDKEYCTNFWETRIQALKLVAEFPEKEKLFAALMEICTHEAARLTTIEEERKGITGR